MMIKNFFRYLIKAVKWGFLSIIIIVVLAFSLILYLNERWLLTGYVKEFMNHHIEGTMDFDSLKFDFDEFPTIRVQLNDGLLIGETELFPNDTLCSVGFLNVKINPLKILKENLIYIPYVYLESPKATVRVNKDGRPAWAIWRFKKPLTEEEKEEEKLKKKKKTKPIQLYIKEADIRDNPVFYYNNEKNRNSMSGKAEQIFIIGRIAIDYKNLTADTLCLTGIDYKVDFKKSGLAVDVSNADILVSKKDSANWMKTYVDISAYLKKMAIKNKTWFVESDVTLLGNLDFSDNFKSFIFKKFNVDLNNDFLSLNGIIKPDAQELFTSLELHFNTVDLRGFFSKFPMINNKFLRTIRYDLPLNVDLSIAGAYSKANDVLPNISSEIHISNAMVKYDSLPSINDICFDGYVKYIPDKKIIDAEIDTLHFNTLNSRLQVKAEVDGPLKDPSFRIATKGNVDLQDIKYFAPKLPWLISGSMDFDLNVKTNDLKFTTHSFYNDIIQGKVSLNDLLIDNRKDNMIIASKACDINIKNELRKENVDAEIYLHNTELLMDSIQIAIDTIDASISMPTITDSIALFNLDTRSNFIVYKKDTLKVNNIFTDVIASFSNNDFNSLDSVNVLMVLNRFALDADSLKFACDNTALSLEAITKNNYGKINSMNDILFNSNFNGGLIINNAQVLTPNPFVNGTLNNATVLFDQDLLNIKDIDLRTPYTKLELDGQIKNWRNYIYKKDTISADLSLITDSLNFNTVMSYIKELGRKKKDTLILKPPATVPKDIIPPNINLKLSLDMNDIIYNGLGGNDLTGMFLVTESSLFLHHLNLRSPMAQMNMDISLHTVENYYEGNLDLLISNFDVQKVIASNPKIIEVVPLAKTLTGELGVSVALKSLFDRRFNPIDQSIYGNAYFQGNNLSVEKDKVLPKWVGSLLLGKKKYIMIDSLKVYLSVDEDVISIYPFETDINRYRFYVSGMQSFDDSFFYHLTLLKWFLPFKLGFNIYGKPDKLHIKLSCPKLHNLKLPSKVLNTQMRFFLPHNRINQNLEDASTSINQNYYNFMQKYNAILGNDDLKKYKNERTRIVNQLDDLIEDKKIGQ